MLGPLRIGHSNLVSVFQKYQLLSSVGPGSWLSRVGPGSWPDICLALSNFLLIDTPKVSLLTRGCCRSCLGAWNLAHWPRPGLSHLHCRSRFGHTGIIIAANSNVALPSSQASRLAVYRVFNAIVVKQAERKNASPGSGGEGWGWGRPSGARLWHVLPLTFASSWSSDVRLECVETSGEEEGEPRRRPRGSSCESGLLVGGASDSDP